MRDLFILGTGVHGAEMSEIVERVNRVTARWRLVGYIAADDQTVAEHGGTCNGYPLMPLVGLADYPDADLVPDNEWPRSLCVYPDRLVSLVDPSVFVSRTARIGRGCVIYPHSYVGLNVRIGDLVFCLSGCIINHDDIIEDRTVFASGVSLAGGVHVEADCYLGQACAVRQHVTIGRGSLVGMGAVVVKNVEPGSVVVGNPARRLRSTEDAP